MEEAMIEQYQLNTCVVAGVTTVLMCNHYMKYCLKHPVRDSSLTGHQWVWELWHGHDRRYFQNMRMRKVALCSLIQSLLSIDSLPLSLKRVTLEESLAIFLLIVGQGVTYPFVEERLQRSSETVSNHFHMVLEAICRLGKYMIKPDDPTFAREVPEIVNNPTAWPAFKGCIGAIDGTHIVLHIPDRDKVPWMNRKGVATTNILAICDFRMCFTFTAVGMEGSMHDSRVLNMTMTNSSMKFPFPPNEKFYLVDAGYPLMHGFLTLYRRVHYHLPEFRHSRRFRSHFEHFNYKHSFLRSIIERTFGVLKKRWRILNNMSMVSMDTEIKIIWACMTLHNFIRKFDADDIDLLGEIPDEHSDLSSRLRTINGAEWVTQSQAETKQMEAFRDRIRDILSSG